MVSKLGGGTRKINIGTASEHGTMYSEEVIDSSNTSLDIYSDKACVDGQFEMRLKGQGWRMHIQRKGSKDKPISEAREHSNKRIAKTRARMEHAFAVLAQMCSKVLRSIAVARRGRT